jgi:uncharacterized protein YraI
MRPRIWVLLALVLVLVAASACFSGRISRQSLSTAVPSKTLRPTFTPTTAKPTLEPTPTAAEPQAAPPVVVEEKPAEAPAAAPTEAPTEVPPTEAPTVAQFTVNSQSMNVRSGPGTNYAAIGRLNGGETHDITGKNPGGDWWEFDFNGRKGWVSAGLVTATAADQVQVAENIPAAPTPRPTARPQPRPTAAPAQPAQPAPPPAPATLFGQAGTEFRNADNTAFDWITFWGRLGPTTGSPISGYSLKVTAPSGEKTMPFGSFWERAYSGYRSAEFLYNVKVELPRTAGGFRAVVVDASGAEVSDAVTGTALDRTHDVIISWQKR